MRYLLPLLLAACHAPTRPDVPPFAVLTQQGILLVENEARTAVPDTEDITSFCWSADGERLFGAVGGALWAIALDGERTPCVRGFHALRFPDAAPSGDRIAFAGQKNEGDEWTLWIVSLPHGPPRNVGPGYSPTWSPDSRHIHYERLATPRGIGELEVASGRHRIEPATGAGAYTPARSPRTGNFLLFSRRELWLHDFRSGSARRLRTTYHLPHRMRISRCAAAGSGGQLRHGCRSFHGSDREMVAPERHQNRPSPLASACGSRAATAARISFCHNSLRQVQGVAARSSLGHPGHPPRRFAARGPAEGVKE